MNLRFAAIVTILVVLLGVSVSSYQTLPSFASNQCNIAAGTPSCNIQLNLNQGNDQKIPLVLNQETQPWSSLSITINVQAGDVISVSVTEPSGFVAKQLTVSGQPQTISISSPPTGTWTVEVQGSSISASTGVVGLAISAVLPVTSTNSVTSSSGSSCGGISTDCSTLYLLIGVVVGVIVVVIAVLALRPKKKEPMPVQVPMAAKSGAVASGPSSDTRVIGTGTVPYYAGLQLPSGQTIPITGMTKEFGRPDFEPYVSKDVTNLISRRHFQISFSVRDKTFVIEDLNSSNGTMLNGSDIKGKGKVPIKDGDIVSPANILNLKFKGS